MLTVRPIPRSRLRWGEMLDGLLGLFAIVLMASSWITHVVICAMEGLWSLLILGLVVFPVAILHGIAVWLAAWV